MKTITTKHWENFFTVVGKLSVAAENEGMSESEVYQFIRKKAQDEGYESELEELVFGLHEYITQTEGEESEEEQDENS